MIRRLRSFVRRTAPQAVARYHAYMGLLSHRESYLYTTGWMASIVRGYPCRPDGTELPWMNYAVLALLEQRLRLELRLFEYGSGYSTLFYARRVRSVTSVEHDRGWYDTMHARVPANATLLFRESDEDGAYCRAIHDGGERYDVAVVDGRDRVHCVLQGLRALSERGVLLLDDSSRASYAPAFAHAHAEGFRSLDFEGLKPTGATLDRTTVFYRPGNCFGI